MYGPSRPIVCNTCAAGLLTTTMARTRRQRSPARGKAHNGQTTETDSSAGGSRLVKRPRRAKQKASAALSATSDGRADDSASDEPYEPPSSASSPESKTTGHGLQVRIAHSLVRQTSMGLVEAVPSRRVAPACDKVDFVLTDIEVEPVKRKAGGKRLKASNIARDALYQVLVEKKISLNARKFSLLTVSEALSVSEEARRVLLLDNSLVEVEGPAKIFGDLHGQFKALQDIFKCYGSPNHWSGDVLYCHYVFNGDFVDRGKYSLETALLLFCLKILYPDRVVLLRGNHEDRNVNSTRSYAPSLLQECTRRLGKQPGRKVYEAINDAFDALPLACLIENSIFVCHGGLGSSVNTLEEIRAIERPLSSDDLDESQLLVDLLWSDPTESDNVLGCHANKDRGGDNIKSFGPDRVEAFCRRTGVQLVVRSHECVQAGFQYFASGRLVTVFSARNYCYAEDNDGAILLVTKKKISGLDGARYVLQVTPKLIRGHGSEQKPKKRAEVPRKDA